MEEKLGRPLKPNEMVKFVDGDKTNLDPKNIYVIIKKTSSARTRLARIEARIVELEAERDALIKEIESRANV